MLADGMIAPCDQTPMIEWQELGVAKEKPSFEEIIKYAKPIIMKFIGEFAADLPSEQKEEIQQDVFLRLAKFYDLIDADKGWKSYVFNHARGGVLDYIKFGKGFQEGKWSLQKSEDPEEARFPHKIFSRIPNTDETGEVVGVEKILGFRKVHSNIDEDRIIIKWELLARMARSDEELHAFAKHLRGIGIEEMAPVFGLCRARVGQLIQAFIARFDDPYQAEDPWFLQTCFALGVCRQLGIPDVDQSVVLGFPVGWTEKPVDLDSVEAPRDPDAENQLNFLLDS